MLRMGKRPAWPCGGIIISAWLTLPLAASSRRKSRQQRMPTSEPAVGMSLKALSPDTRSQLNLDLSVGGVVVAQVTPGSKADESGVQAGDVIERVAGNVVSTPTQVADAIHSAEQQKKDAIPLLVMRSGTTSYLGLELAAG